MDQMCKKRSVVAHTDDGPQAYSNYFDQVEQLFSVIRTTQASAIQKAAATIAEAMARDNILHVFGTGHSHMFAEELFYRAGGFANVNAILETGLMLHEGAAKSTALERLHGYAPILLDRYDIKPGDVLIIASNSGINPVPVEMARTACQRKLATIAITSLKHSKAMASRDIEGQKLYEVVDQVIDNCCELGDASVTIEGMPYPIGPLSSLAGILILNSIMCQVAQGLVARGKVPPIYVSSNVGVGDQVSSHWVAAFKDRIKHL